ncbi:MAG: F0F1 ATP synthase subunit epsilon [Ignavibacteriaceae bacterium]|nr:F0F1 ATP synthase subunit epsilon [Ignavibacteriaceae bacterium]
MKEFDLEIVTPARVCYTGKVESVTVPGSLGEFQVLVNHAPILSTFEIGGIKVVENKESSLYFATSGGTVDVIQNKVLILANAAEKPEEIDVARAEKSAERARNRIRESGKEIDIMRAEASLARALNRIKISTWR